MQILYSNYVSSNIRIRSSVVPGVTRAIFLLSTMGSCGCSEPLSHALVSIRTWLFTAQGILPQQAEEEERVMEASIAHSALCVILI